MQLGYERLAFGDALKHVAEGIWGEGFDRERLQRLGVAVRDIDPDAWLHALSRRLSPGDGPVVIDDCRFPNEFWFLKGRGFVTVRVESHTWLRVNRLKDNGKYTTPEQMNHISETALDAETTDYRVRNDGDKTELFDDIVHILERERRRR